MTDISPESRDYSFDQIEDDPRLKRTTKEFFITLSVYIIYGILMITNLFVFGQHSTVAPEESCAIQWAHSQIFGLPLWIFNLICLLIGMVITVELVCKFGYKDMSLTDNEAKKEAE